MKIEGTIDLSEVREIGFISRQKGSFTVELFSANLSGDTVFTLQHSVTGDHFDVAQDAGEDISETLVDDTAFVKSYEVDPAVHFKIVFEGLTTGDVDYSINVN